MDLRTCAHALPNDGLAAGVIQNSDQKRKGEQKAPLYFLEFNSEVKLQRELDNAGVARLCNLSKVRVKTVVVRIEELSMVERIKELGPELQRPALGKRKRPAHRKIEVIPTRPAYYVPPGVAEAENRHIGAIKCGWIEIEVGWSDHRSAQAVRGIKIRKGVQRPGTESLNRSDEIGAIEKNVLLAGVIVVEDGERCSCLEACNATRFPVLS